MKVKQIAFNGGAPYIYVITEDGELLRKEIAVGVYELRNYIDKPWEKIDVDITNVS